MTDYATQVRQLSVTTQELQTAMLIDGALMPDQWHYTLQNVRDQLDALAREVRDYRAPSMTAGLDLELPDDGTCACPADALVHRSTCAELASWQ